MDERQRRNQSLRLWPGVLIVAVQYLLMFALPAAAPEAAQFGVLAGLAGGLAIPLWWAFFSRAPLAERWGGVVLMAAALAATPSILHESIATGGRGVLFFVYAAPTVSLAFVVWAIASRRIPAGPRRATMAAAILLACGGWALLRTAGVTGGFASDFAWRWSATPEDRLLALEVDEPAIPAAASPIVAEEIAHEPIVLEEPGKLPEQQKPPTEWSGFRGPRRDGVTAGVRIETDWEAAPPVELWRRPIGPGWSSFAVSGNRIYTQEQRGEDEVVASYDLATGAPVWMHRSRARFWESNAGAGPRGTPTLSDGRVYTLGGTGIVNALNAQDGSIVWSRDAASDTGAKLPGWGFAGSPLAVDDLVIVAASGTLAAYDRNTGEPRWLGPVGRGGYSSPVLLTIDGIEQIVQLNGDGAAGIVPADGMALWRYAWQGSPIVQPGVTSDGDLLIAVSDTSGTRRIRAMRRPEGWQVEEHWTSRGLKPYFNDFVVHKGHAYGFDGRILACIDLKDGERVWKGGRYGNGQLVLLADQDLLLVLSEMGELALVDATPVEFQERARFAAIEGKTWNHPVIAGDVLLVRNGEEMAAFRLKMAGS